ncbi:hypothetical protein PIB30_038163 [Stylosanthes scabra]|uniref:Uncharacterized protein n=1 Tax=Stylosanthes scabra TaxID=79078 RepID=A0ABU6XEB2_9FABA|nr:hypothetical protein [Stylosanthes scabra]
MPSINYFTGSVTTSLADLNYCTLVVLKSRSMQIFLFFLQSSPSSPNLTSVAPYIKILVRFERVRWEQWGSVPRWMRFPMKGSFGSDGGNPVFESKVLKIGLVIEPFKLAVRGFKGLTSSTEDSTVL